MLGDIGGILLTILLAPFLIIGLLVIVLAGLINECGEFLENIIAIRQ